MLQVLQIPVWNDNYVYLLTDEASGESAVVDAPEADAMLRIEKEKGLKITTVFNTHHHFDHVGGNKALAEGRKLRVVAHESDRGRVPELTDAVADGTEVRLGESSAKVIFVPGHTSGHIAYWFEKDKALFCGDALFVGGCGRLFEGTPAQMQQSLAKLRQLPDDAKVYCAHEYTANNLRFALAVEPSNPELKKKAEWAKAETRVGNSTVPSTLAEEKSYNPFLRWDAPDVISAARQHDPDAGEDPAKVFAAIRGWKDRF